MPIDYKQYPPNWKTEIVPNIIARAHNKCEFCGIANGQLRATGSKVVLTIAHLDHDPENWAVQNERLRALCQKCHLRYDLSRHIYKRKYGRSVFKNNYDIFE